MKYRFLRLIAAAVIVTGCSDVRTDLTLVRTDSRIDAEIIDDVLDLLGDDPTIDIALTDEPRSDSAALDALLAGEADIAVVSNNMPYTAGISTVLPLYPTVLHIGHIGDPGAEVELDVELFRGARIFAGTEGSASRLMFERFIGRLGLTREDYTYVRDARVDLERVPEDERPNVFVVFAPVSPDRLPDIPGLRLLGGSAPQDIGAGSAIDAAVLMNPHLRPFVIPMTTYGDATPEPVVTLAVDMMLVGRSDLSPSVVYDLIGSLAQLRPALASRRPGLFQKAADDFNTGSSTFVLHPGLVAYLNRNEPSVYERYSGIAEVVVTVIVALFSATFAGVRIYHMRRKNRIDAFYTKIIAIRNSLTEGSSEAERKTAVQEIRALQNEAFDMLVNEKLSADESFRIFISLSNDALRDFETSSR